MKKNADAWTKLVLRTMPVAELKAEIANPANTPAERAAMRVELAGRIDNGSTPKRPRCMPNRDAFTRATIAIDPVDGGPAGYKPIR